MTDEKVHPTEEWVYQGVRVAAGGKRLHGWLNPAGRTWYFGKVRGHVVGGTYRVQAEHPGEGKIVVYGSPVYLRTDAEPGQRAVWEAEHAAAEAELAGAARERNAARQSALDAAAEPLVDIAKGLRTGAQRDALIAYVIRRLSTAW